MNRRPLKFYPLKIGSKSEDVIVDGQAREDFCASLTPMTTNERRMIRFFRLGKHRHRLMRVLSGHAIEETLNLINGSIQRRWDIYRDDYYINSEDSTYEAKKITLVVSVTETGELLNESTGQDPDECDDLLDYFEFALKIPPIPRKLSLDHGYVETIANC